MISGTMHALGCESLRQLVGPLRKQGPSVEKAGRPGIGS